MDNNKLKLPPYFGVRLTGYYTYQYYLLGMLKAKYDMRLTLGEIDENDLDGAPYEQTVNIYLFSKDNEGRKDEAVEIVRFIEQSRQLWNIILNTNKINLS